MQPQLAIWQCYNGPEQMDVPGSMDSRECAVDTLVPRTSPPQLLRSHIKYNVCLRDRGCERIGEMWIIRHYGCGGIQMKYVTRHATTSSGHGQVACFWPSDAIICPSGAGKSGVESTCVALNLASHRAARDLGIWERSVVVTRPPSNITRLQQLWRYRAVSAPAVAVETSVGRRVVEWVSAKKYLPPTLIAAQLPATTLLTTMHHHSLCGEKREQLLRLITYKRRS